MTRHLCLSLAFLLPPLLAQDPAPEAQAPAAPSPKTREHGALAALAGTWRTTATAAAMPGVPGMEEASEWTGFEIAELVCDGLWLKVTGDSKCKDKVCSGLWMLGYDPFAKRFQCLFASDAAAAPGLLDATYDEKVRTWTFTGASPMGQFRSVFVLQDHDTSVETVYSIDGDGKEHETMRIERKRLEGAIPQPAAVAAVPADAPVALAALLQDRGTWKADLSMVMPGAKPITAKCREVVRAICGGKWLWTDFTGTVMGAPFEGHALTGWDATKQRVVSFWVYSWSPLCMRTEGVYDPAKGSFALRGTSYDEAGRAVPVTQVITRESDGARVQRLTFGEGEEQCVETILFERVGK